MTKSDEVKISDLLERVRKNLRQQDGEPEPEVIPEEFITRQEQKNEEQRISRERGELIKELFGAKTEADESALIEDYFDTQRSVDVISDDDDLPMILEDALNNDSDISSDVADGVAVDYNLISMFGMQDVEDEDGNDTQTVATPDEDEELPINFVDYENTAQTKFFGKRFQTIFNRCKIRVIFLAILLLFTFLIENVTLFVKNPVGFLSAQQYPVVYFLWGVQILLLSGVFTYRKIFKGLGRLFKGSPSLESVYSIAYILNVAYMSYLLATDFKYEPVLFNMTVVLLALVCETSDLLVVVRQMYSFAVMTQKGEKHVVEKQKEEEIEQELAELDDFIDGRTNFLRITKTDKITGFFKRFETHNSLGSVVTVAIPLMVLVCAILALLSYMNNNSLQTALQAAMLGLGLSLPVCMCVSYSVPAYRMTKKLFEVKAAVIGNKAISEYSSPAVMQLKDTDIFPSHLASTVGIKTFGDAPLDTALHYYAAVFAPLGGPLGGLFRNATSDYKVTNDVDYIRIDDDGIECSVDDRHIFVGKYSYINRCGYSLYKQTAQDEEESGGVYSLYMVMDDRVVAVVTVKYNISKDVKRKLYNLRRAGIGICVRTFDPNISTSMVLSMLGDSALALRVIKCKKRSQRRASLRQSSSGIITSGDPSSLYNALACAEKCKIAVRALQVMSVISIMLGGVIGYFLITFSASPVTSAPVLLFHLFWLVISILVTKLFG